MPSYDSRQPILFPVDDSTLADAGKLTTVPIFAGIIIALLLGIFFFPFIVIQYFLNLSVYLIDGNPFTLNPKKIYLRRNLK